MIEFISTRGFAADAPKNFEDVLLAGLAPDGGLFIPTTWPQVDVKSLKGKSYIEIAEAVTYPFVEGVIDREDYKEILQETYSPETFRDPAVTPLKQLNDQIYVMEQFHGPTIAFKDVALQLLGRLFNHILTRKNERITIVGATSGDTGSAAIEGCAHAENIDIFILFPKSRVSEVQRRQMTTVLADGVHNIALDGTFDDCQNMVKAMFADEDFRADMKLSAVNSINWARIMAQIVYYFTTAIELGAADGKDVSFIVPTGNFGNVLAGYCAKNMGLPIKRLGISTNKNDILTRFFETGAMKADGVEATLSPSMDIQISSNFERYLYFLLNKDSEKLTSIMHEFKDTGAFQMMPDMMEKAREDFAAYRMNDEDTLAMIKDIEKEFGYTLDPHTATGMKGAREMADETGGAVVLLATAHPAKFPDAVEKATGKRPDLPEHLADLFEREEHMTNLSNNRETVQDFVRKHTRNAGSKAA